jgi:hypothetical protein
MRRDERRIVMGFAAAALVLAVACDGAADAPATDQSAAEAVEVVDGFLEAYGRFDAAAAATYLAPDAVITQLMVGAEDVEGTLHELRLNLAMLEATRFEQMLGPCEVVSASASTSRITVDCSFDFHMFGSQEIGRGPFTDATYSFTVLDGKIATAEVDFDYADDLSPQMWEPFAEWVYEAYPEDAEVMYADPGAFQRLSEESVELWREHVRDYVQVVQSA